MKRLLDLKNAPHKCCYSGALPDLGPPIFSSVDFLACYLVSCG